MSGHLLTRKIARVLPYRQGARALQRLASRVIAHAHDSQGRIIGLSMEELSLTRLQLAYLELLICPDHRMASERVELIEAEHRDVNLLDSRKDLAGNQRALNRERLSIDAVKSADVIKRSLRGDIEHPRVEVSHESNGCLKDANAGSVLLQDLAVAEPPWNVEPLSIDVQASGDERPLPLDSQDKTLVNQAVNGTPDRRFRGTEELGEICLGWYRRPRGVLPLRDALPQDLPDPQI